MSKKVSSINFDLDIYKALEAIVKRSKQSEATATTCSKLVNQLLRNSPQVAAELKALKCSPLP